LLCELALHGIGGHSIAEVQKNLSYREVQQWAAYRRLRGTLNWGMRIERAAALITSVYINSKQKKGSTPYSVHDLMPHAGEQEITLEEAMKTWR
jgi:hypothetical protein